MVSIRTQSFLIFIGNTKVMKSVRSLLTFTKKELESADICSECYFNANERPQTFFTDVCAMPHLVVWAKMRNYRQWPAKLMSINGTTVNVRFFQVHTNANVLAANCYLYSQGPLIGPPNGKDDHITNAFKVRYT